MSLPTPPSPTAPAPTEVRRGALLCLEIDDPVAKVAAVQALALATRYRRGPLPIDAQAELAPSRTLPGRPAKPELVPVKSLSPRSAHTPEGRAALLHAIAHIEFNAINLALDAMWRFAGMPPAYYRGWMLVADEESQHYVLLADHLATLGHAYGDFAAHDGLWSMVERTAGDVLARMALVPRTLEARGLDATPPLQAKLKAAGDARAAEILGVILRDEIGHVSIGNHWYRWLCKRDKLDPVAIYPELAERYGAPKPRAPFNLPARAAAGFTPAELAWLAQ